MAYVYFVDRSIGKKGFSEALRQANIKLEIHDKHFAQNTPDIVWIPQVSQQGWVIITADKHIRYRQIERQAVESSNARLFILKSATAERQAELFLNALPKIESFLQRHSGPFIAKVTEEKGKRSIAKTKVTKVYPKKSGRS
ncbi:MAG: hypothetical protein U5L04_03395 [Trueperaceae bacterium]|nr:hypothetical protein [Trueperaceae bacterium]